MERDGHAGGPGISGISASREVEVASEHTVADDIVYDLISIQHHALKSASSTTGFLEDTHSGEHEDVVEFVRRCKREDERSSRRSTMNCCAGIPSRPKTEAPVASRAGSTSGTTPADDTARAGCSHPSTTNWPPPAPPRHHDRTLHETRGSSEHRGIRDVDVAGQLDQHRQLGRSPKYVGHGFSLPAGGIKGDGDGRELVCCLATVTSATRRSCPTVTSAGSWRRQHPSRRAASDQTIKTRSVSK